MSNIVLINISLETFSCIILAIIMVCLLVDKNKKTYLNRCFTRLLTCYLIVLPSDILAWFLDGNTSSYARPMLIAVNLFVLTFSAIGASVYNDYVITFISIKTNISRKLVYIVYWLSGIQVVLLIISQFNHMFYFFDETNHYCRGYLFWLPYVLPALISIMQITIILRYRKKLGTNNMMSFLFYNILLFTGIALQMMLPLVMLLYVSVSIGMFIVYIRIQLEHVNKQEAELTNARINVMLSQIGPHFLYNSLVAIRSLCHSSPETASEAIGEFAGYLRGNLESLSLNKPIPFEKELKHVEVYLSLEKKRFCDRLNIVYNIAVKNFCIPALTLQPIVENAVRYGITKSTTEGTVTIVTTETDAAFIITVYDDGVGFDPSVTKQDGRAHVGIENVRSRLAAMCGGTLEISSTLNVGTTAKITIPKGDSKI